MLVIFFHSRSTKLLIWVLKKWLQFATVTRYGSYAFLPKVSRRDSADYARNIERNQTWKLVNWNGRTFVRLSDINLMEKAPNKLEFSNIRNNSSVKFIRFVTPFFVLLLGLSTESMVKNWEIYIGTEHTHTVELHIWRRSFFRWV